MLSNFIILTMKIVLRKEKDFRKCPILFVSELMLFYKHLLTLYTGIKSVRATLPDEIFTGEFAS
jgi:hypothetical protein